MSHIRAFAFDLDGTLVDSAGGVAEALNSALGHAGLAPFDVLTVRSWIGDGPDALIARALASRAGKPSERPGLAASLRQCFDRATLAAPMAGCSVFDGVRPLLQALHGRLPLVVVTNKPTVLARAVLDEAGLLPHFASLHGAETAAQRKPSPQLILWAAEGLGMAVEDLLMIGDSPADLDAAQAAGCRAAWAGWGYGQAPESRHAHVWRLVEPADLLSPGAPQSVAFEPIKNIDSRRHACPPVESPRSPSSSSRSAASIPPRPAI